MAYNDSVQEIMDALSDMKPNAVVALSDEAGKLLLETVAKLEEMGEI